MPPIVSTFKQKRTVSSPPSRLYTRLATSPMSTAAATASGMGVGSRAGSAGASVAAVKRAGVGPKEGAASVPAVQPLAPSTPARPMALGRKRFIVVPSLT